jgi:hypothetical protein
MRVKRSRFVIGFGAFATAGVLRVPARAQMMPPPGLNTDLGHQGAFYRFALDVGSGEHVICRAAVLPRQSFAAAIVEQTTRDNAEFAVQDVARQSGATVAINGGRFNGAFQPDGLLMVNGRTIGQKRADWIGYLTIDNAGNAAVTDKPDLGSARYALQGDPLIIEPRGKIGMMREDNQRFRRSIIAQSGDVIIAMVTSPVSLFSLAYGLMENPHSLFLTHIDAALNLSGAATTSMYVKFADRSEMVVQALWPNRSVITFTARSALRG